MWKVDESCRKFVKLKVNFYKPRVPVGFAKKTLGSSLPISDDILTVNSVEPTLGMGRFGCIPSNRSFFLQHLVYDSDDL